MKQRGVREDAAEELVWEIKSQKILLPNFAPGIGAAKPAAPSSPIGLWPSADSVLRSRPGPQPKSSIVNGGSPSICRNSAAMFWLTS
jgi:hypothetical protein